MQGQSDKASTGPTNTLKAHGDDLLALSAESRYPHQLALITSEQQAALHGAACLFSTKPRQLGQGFARVGMGQDGRWRASEVLGFSVVTDAGSNTSTFT